MSISLFPPPPKESNTLYFNHLIERYITLLGSRQLKKIRIGRNVLGMRFQSNSQSPATLYIQWNRITKDEYFLTLIHSFMRHFILSFEIMYLIPCITTCYGPGIMGRKDVSANTHQNSRVIRDGSRCQITNAFTDFSNQITMFLVWPLDGGSAPFTLFSLPLQLRTCHPLLSLGPSTWLLHVAPPTHWDGSRRRGTGCASAV